jgi:hypothetical protein
MGLFPIEVSKLVFLCNLLANGIGLVIFPRGHQIATRSAG